MQSKLWRNATPEQHNLWRQASALIAWNTITPIFYQGTTFGTEFLVYDAAKLYIALEFMPMYNAAIVSIDLYNIANAVFSQILSGAIGTGLQEYNVKNCYFSRILPSAACYIKFNGYRLTTI